MSDERETPFGPEPDLENRLGQLGDDPEMLEFRAEAAESAREAELPGTGAGEERGSRRTKPQPRSSGGSGATSSRPCCAARPS